MAVSVRVDVIVADGADVGVPLAAGSEVDELTAVKVAVSVIAAVSDGVGVRVAVLVGVGVAEAGPFTTICAPLVVPRTERPAEVADVSRGFPK